jgi:phasin family protein
MSEPRPKRAPREATRRNGGAATAGSPTAANPTAANPTAPAEIDAGSTPETATAAVALATATAAEPIPEPVITQPKPAAEAAPAAPQAPGSKPASEELWADPWSALTEAQSALARGFEEAATEFGGLTRSGIAATTEAANAMLGAKTLAEAIEINTGYARRGFDAMLGGAAKLSEIGVKTATDASRPILNRLGESWKSLNGH